MSDKWILIRLTGLLILLGWITPIALVLSYSLSDRWGWAISLIATIVLTITGMVFVSWTYSKDND